MNGPARKALDAAAARALAVMRIFGISLQVIVIIGWHRWYLTPAHLAVPALAVAWGVVFTVRCLRGRIDRVTASGELVVTATLVVTARWCLPPATVAGPNWVWVRLGGASTAIGWCVPVGWWLAYTAGLAAAGALGFLAAGLPAAKVAFGVGAEVLVAGLCTVAAVVLRRGAGRADGALRRVGEEQQAQAVAATRLQAQREAERVLHDTVLNTLAGLAWGAPGSSDDLIRERCRDSVDECAELLGSREHPGSPRTLAVRLEDVIAHARRDGLAVNASVRPEIDAPPDVGAAVAATVAEALSNVARHSGVATATVTVVADDLGLRVTVADRGRGFEPRDSPPDRLGVRYSIMDRMADVGGSADVDSARGRGTTITVRWSPTVVERPSLAAATTMLEQSYARDTAVAVGVAILLWQAGLGVLLVVRHAIYRDPLLVAVAWTVLTATLAWCVTGASGGRLPWPGADRRIRSPRSHPPGAGGASPGLTRRGVALLTLAALAAQLAAGWSVRGDALPSHNWTLLAGEGVTIFLQAVRPRREWVPVALLTTGTALGLIFGRGGLDPAAISRITTLLYSQVTIMAVLWVLLNGRHAAAGITARASRAEADLATQRLAAAEVRRDRRERLSRLADGPIRLLREVGAGHADPRDPEVGRRSAACAAALRRSLTRPTAPPTSLLSTLEPALADAEQRGVSIEIQTVGPLDHLPAGTREEVVDLVASRLACIVRGRVLLTVLGNAARGSVCLSFDAAGAGVPPPRDGGRDTAPAGRVGDPGANGWTDVVEDVDEGRASVEIRWGTSRVHPAGP
ncbi:MAG: sensor histidine kinase [Frankia sp.]